MGRVSSAIPKSVLTAVADIITASAVGVPSRLALGAALQGLRVNAGATALEYAAAAGGAVTRAGGNTTEATTTSTGAVDLLTATVSIGASIPMKIKAKLKRSGGAGNSSSAGLKINATQVVPSSSLGTTDPSSSPFEFDGFSASTGYVRIGILRTNHATGGNNLAADTDFPVATITSVIVVALVANAAVTIGADEMHVYTYAVS